MRTYSHRKFAEDDAAQARMQGDVCRVIEAPHRGRSGWGVQTTVSALRHWRGGSAQGLGAAGRST
jgi:hypothetical protein